MRDGHNGYTASAGIEPAREAVAAEYTSRGMPVSADRVILTSGTSEGIELALGALADAGDEVLVPTPTYPLYTAVLAKIGARAVYYRTDPSNHWLPDLDDVKRLMTAGDARARRHRSEQSDRGGVSGVDASRADRSRRCAPACRSSPTRSTAISASTARCRCSAVLEPDAPILSFSSLSKAYLAPGWRAGWLAVGRSRSARRRAGARSRSWPTAGCAARGRCSTRIEAALTGDRSHQREFVARLRSCART